jgi:hypothetical protein
MRDTALDATVQSVKPVPSQFTTGNSELAAFLMASGHRLLGIAVNASRAEFSFADNVDRSVQETVAAYAANDAIGGKSLMESFRLVKSLAKDAVGRTSAKSGEVRHVSKST